MQEPDRRTFGQPVSTQRCKQSGDKGWSEALREQNRRTRIMQALVEVFAERGFAGATVGLVIRRAGISTRTFYRSFNDLEECLITIMDSVLEDVSVLVSRELRGTDCWQDGVRSALASVLSYLDREPELARVCIVETLAGGHVVLAHRQHPIEAFCSLVIERIEREVSNISPLAAEGAMSLVLGIMHAHIVRGSPGLFIELLGPLMGLAMAPYLDASGTHREIKRGEELTKEILAGESRWAMPAQAPDRITKHDRALSKIIGNPSSHRARECLLFLAEHPDASNREIAMGIHITHQSQISKLLAYLAQEGLAIKRSAGKGKRNAWQPTPRGQEIARVLSSNEPKLVTNNHNPRTVNSTGRGNFPLLTLAEIASDG